VNEGDVKPEVVRIISIGSERVVKLKFQDGSTRKIKFDDMIQYYMKLNPDGLFTVSNVSIGTNEGTNLFDVIVTLYNNANTKKGDTEPSVICRQNINDVFSNMINASGKAYVGCCITKETLPTDVPYQIFTTCDYIESSDVVAVYIDDELEDILECIKLQKYNNSLDALFTDSLKRCDSKEDRYDAIKGGCNIGYVRTVKDLLESNSFMIDFYATFGIIKTAFNLVTNPITGDVEDMCRVRLSKIFECNFETLSALPYDKDVDLAKIHNGRYFLLKDATNTLYVIIYNSDVEINPNNINYVELYSGYESPFKNIKNKLKER
jgi:hypothetical protein